MIENRVYAQENKLELCDEIETNKVSPLKMDIAEDARYLKRYNKTVLYVDLWYMSILQRYGDMLAMYSYVFV